MNELEGGRTALILGTDSASNLGDQAILKTLIGILRERGFDSVHVRSYRPTVTRDRLSGVHEVDSVDRMPWMITDGAHHLETIARTSLAVAKSRVASRFGKQVLPEADVAVFVGGRYLTSPYFGAQWITALTARELRRAGTKVILAPQTIGPVATVKEKIALSILLQSCETVMSREDETTEFLRHFGVAGPRYLPTPDLVYRFAPATVQAAQSVLVENGIEPRSSRPLVLVADRPLVSMASAERPNASDHTGSMARLMDLLSADHDLLFLSTTYQSPGYDRNDVLCGLAIQSAMQHPDRLRIATKEPTAEVLKACYGLADATITTRMHPIIMSASEGTPVFSYAYEPKCHGQLAIIGHPEWAYALDADPAAIYRDVVDSIARGSELRRELRSAAATLQTQVDVSFDLALGE